MRNEVTSNGYGSGIEGSELKFLLCTATDFLHELEQGTYCLCAFSPSVRQE